jgi:hypothetical protein
MKCKVFYEGNSHTTMLHALGGRLLPWLRDELGD